MSDEMKNHAILSKLFSAPDEKLPEGLYAMPIPWCLTCKGTHEEQQHEEDCMTLGFHITATRLGLYGGDE